MADLDNVWAELGGAFGMKVIEGPMAVGHLLGQLLLAFGEDRILWGTDAIWSGTPQWQIDALKTFVMPKELLDLGYPQVTDAIKAKIFGLNAASLYGIDPDEVRCTLDGDTLARGRHRYREEGWYAPSLRTYGPRTRREFLDLVRRGGG